MELRRKPAGLSKLGPSMLSDTLTQPQAAVASTAIAADPAVPTR